MFTYIKFFLICILFNHCATHHKPVEKTISINNETISYSACGAGDTTLLFIHGWCIDNTYWEDQIDFFCKKYQVLAIDLPGFGKSSANRKDFTFDLYIEDVYQMISSLKLSPVVAIGHSMSGDIVLGLAAKYPDIIHSIIGIDNLHQPAPKKDSIASAEEKKFYAYFEANYDSVAINTSNAYLFSTLTPDTVRKRVLSNILNTPPARSINGLRNLSTISDFQKDRMQKLKVPLRLVNSDLFPIAIDSLKVYCKHGVEVELVQGTGHYPMIEKPKEFNEALQRMIWR